jgi:hypothetical protein
MAAAAGCAGNIAETRQARAAGEWNVRLPTSASPVASFGYGRGGNATPAPEVSAEPTLLASAAPQRERSRVQPHSVVRAASTPAPAPMPAPNATVVAQTEAPNIAAPAATESVSQPVQFAAADPSVQQRYGARQASKLEKFKGGDLIVIGAGTLVIVLIVVLLLVLLI